MSLKKVAFLTTFSTDQPDEGPKEVSVFQKKKPNKVQYAKWMSMSALSCRDFTKNTYDYRDRNFILSDEGLTFRLPKHLNEVYRRANVFQKTEFRKIPLKPGKLRNENKNIYRNMTESSANALTNIKND